MPTRDVVDGLGCFGLLRYYSTVDLRLDNSTDKAYLQLELKGRASHPSLLFDRREVVLPIVPVGVKATTRFFIINKGYTALSAPNRRWLAHCVFVCTVVNRAVADLWTLSTYQVRQPRD